MCHCMQCFCVFVRACVRVCEKEREHTHVQQKHALNHSLGLFTLFALCHHVALYIVSVPLFLFLFRSLLHTNTHSQDSKNL